MILIVEIASIMVCKGGGYLNYARRDYDEFLETNDIVLERAEWEGYQPDEILYGEVTLDYESSDLAYYGVDEEMYEVYTNYNTYAREW